MKRIVFVAYGALIAVLLVCLFSGAVFRADADSYYDEESNKTIIDTNWWFEDISVEIDVRKDKTFAVTETMRIGFINGGKNTGIIRDIQRISRTTRVIDGRQVTGERYLAELSDMSFTINGAPAKVTESLYNQGQFFSVKMQKPDLSYFPATDQSKS